MCGLFGVATSKATPRLGQLTIQLAIENVSRGRTSWGVCLNGSKIIKAMGPIDNSLYKVPMVSKGVVLGHTRAATVGAHTEPNSHPWEFPMKDGGKVIGAHNGTVGNWQELNKKYDRKYEVDSMHIFGHIAEGLDKSEIVGYGAVTFIKQNHLYLCKFNGGSLSVAQLENDKKEPVGIVWSSEESVLRKALLAANLSFYVYDLTEDNTYFYADDALWNTKEKIGITSYERYNSKKWLVDNNNENNISRYRGHHRSVMAPSTDAKKSERFVRLQIMREPTITVAPAELNPEQKQQQEIMRLIATNAKVSTQSNLAAPCVSCNMSTTRRFLGKVVMCLVCISKKVQSGEVQVTGVDLPAVQATEEVGHA